MVLGEGRKITVKHLFKLGQDAKLLQVFIDSVIEQTRYALAQWKDLSQKFDVEKNKAVLINRILKNI